MLAQTLWQLGYNWSLHTTARCARSCVRTSSPDVALLDIGLPVMDGYELARAPARRATADAASDLIAVTGYGQEGDRNRTTDAGFDHHLVKPIDLEELTTLLERVVADD